MIKLLFIEIKLKKRERIDQISYPTAVCWHPQQGAEKFALAATNDYKFKLINPSTQNTRRTALAPLAGGHIRGMQVVPRQDDAWRDQILSFRTDERIIGLVRLPLDGNPNRNASVFAHADKALHKTFVLIVGC